MQGCRSQLSFRVQNELVAGLKYRHVVKKMGMVPVDKSDHMLGSFAPGTSQVKNIPMVGRRRNTRRVEYLPHFLRRRVWMAMRVRGGRCAGGAEAANRV